MTTREITPQARPVYTYSASRPRPVGSRFEAVRSKPPTDPHGDTCQVRFLKDGNPVFEEAIALIAATPAQAVLHACQEALHSWRQQSTYSAKDLTKRGFGTNPEDWDEAEVNGKRFPRPANL